MIHEVGVELDTELRRKGCPLRVVDGPERREPNTFGRERIVIEHDPSGDSFGSKHLANVNPKTFLTRSIGVKLTIFAQSPNAGANEFEHRRRAEHALDLVLVAINRIASIRKNAWSPKSGRFVLPDDLSKTETAGGAVYELNFTFDRGVAERTWAGDARPTAAAAGFDRTTKVSLKGGPDDDNDPSTVPADAETSCGS